MRLKDKVALITGGGTGIGAAVAERFVAAGGKVVLMGRRREPLEAIAKPIGGVAVAGDAAEARDVCKAIDAAKTAFGQLDILIANAGGFGGGPTLTMTDEVWAESARANLDTAFVCARETLPSLIDRKGNIVVVSSIGGVLAGPHAAAYITMKHAVIGLTRSLARDFGPKGVRTNAVCPGFVTTAMADGQMEFLVQKLGLKSVDEAYALVSKDVPLRRPTTPVEVANLVCFLASDEASGMNGSICMVDGGASTVAVATVAFDD